MKFTEKTLSVKGSKIECYEYSNGPKVLKIKDVYGEEVILGEEEADKALNFIRSHLTGYEGMKELKSWLSYIDDETFKTVCEEVAIERAARNLKKDLDSYSYHLTLSRFRIRYYDKKTGSITNYFCDAQNQLKAREIYESEGPGILPIVEVKNLSEKEGQ